MSAEKEIFLLVYDLFITSNFKIQLAILMLTNYSSKQGDNRRLVLEWKIWFQDEDITSNGKMSTETFEHESFILVWKATQNPNELVVACCIFLLSKNADSIQIRLLQNL